MEVFGLRHKHCAVNDVANHPILHHFLAIDVLNAFADLSAPEADPLEDLKGAVLDDGCRLFLLLLESLNKEPCRELLQDFLQKAPEAD